MAEKSVAKATWSQPIERLVSSKAGLPEGYDSKLNAEPSHLIVRPEPLRVGQIEGRNLTHPHNCKLISCRILHIAPDEKTGGGLSGAGNAKYYGHYCVDLATFHRLVPIDFSTIEQIEARKADKGQQSPCSECKSAKRSCDPIAESNVRRKGTERDRLARSAGDLSHRKPTNPSGQRLSTHQDPDVCASEPQVGSKQSSDKQGADVNTSHLFGSQPSPLRSKSVGRWLHGGERKEPIGRKRVEKVSDHFPGVKSENCLHRRRVTVRDPLCLPTYASRQSLVLKLRSPRICSRTLSFAKPKELSFSPGAEEAEEDKVKTEFARHPALSQNRCQKSDGDPVGKTKASSHRYPSNSPARRKKPMTLQLNPESETEAFTAPLSKKSVTFADTMVVFTRTGSANKVALNKRKLKPASEKKRRRKRATSDPGMRYPLQTPVMDEKQPQQTVCISVKDSHGSKSEWHNGDSKSAVVKNSVPGTITESFVRKHRRRRGRSVSWSSSVNGTEATSENGHGEHHDQQAVTEIEASNPEAQTCPASGEEGKASERKSNKIPKKSGKASRSFTRVSSSESIDVSVKGSHSPREQEHGFSRSRELPALNVGRKQFKANLSDVLGSSKSQSTVGRTSPGTGGALVCSPAHTSKQNPALKSRNSTKCSRTSSFTQPKELSYSKEAADSEEDKIMSIRSKDHLEMRKEYLSAFSKLEKHISDDNSKSQPGTDTSGSSTVAVSMLEIREDKSGKNNRETRSLSEEKPKSKVNSFRTVTQSFLNLGRRKSVIRKEPKNKMPPLCVPDHKIIFMDNLSEDFTFWGAPKNSTIGNLGPAQQQMSSGRSVDSDQRTGDKSTLKNTSQTSSDNSQSSIHQLCSAGRGCNSRRNSSETYGTKSHQTSTPSSDKSSNSQSVASRVMQKEESIESEANQTCNCFGEKVENPCSMQDKSTETDCHLLFPLLTQCRNLDRGRDCSHLGRWISSSSFSGSRCETSDDWNTRELTLKQKCHNQERSRIRPSRVRISFSTVRGHTSNNKARWSSTTLHAAGKPPPRSAFENGVISAPITLSNTKKSHSHEFRCRKKQAAMAVSKSYSNVGLMSSSKTFRTNSSAKIKYDDNSNVIIASKPKSNIRLHEKAKTSLGYACNTGASMSKTGRIETANIIGTDSTEAQAIAETGKGDIESPSTRTQCDDDGSESFDTLVEYRVSSGNVQSEGCEDTVSVDTLENHESASNIL